MTSDSLYSLFVGDAVDLKKSSPGTSLAVQWLRHHVSTSGDTGSIPGQWIKIPCAECSQKLEKKQKQKTNPKT